MGWFWGDAPSANTVVECEIPVSSTISAAPGGVSGLLVGLLWASQDGPKSGSAAPAGAFGASETSQCPVDHTKLMGKKPAGCPVDHTAVSGKKPAGCPVDHTKLAGKKPSGCPVDHDGKVNPLNNMPSNLSASKIPGQTVDLPTARTISSIPRGEEAIEGNWEYPSPQQMLNAMVRKTGMNGIDEGAVESMVSVHNFLNEGVWSEVLEWEAPYTAETGTTPRLLKFTGRPGDLSPRARLFQFLGKIYPSRFGFPPPFDRHDWTVLRKTPGEGWKEVRYVIDFYEAPDEGDAPAFTVDVRPAADSVENVLERVKKSAVPVWDKALGRT